MFKKDMLSSAIFKIDYLFAVPFETLANNFRVLILYLFFTVIQ